MMTVVALSAIRTDRDQKGGVTIAIRISTRDLSRLQKAAKYWDMELAEAAASIVSSALDPRRRM